MLWNEGTRVGGTAEKIYENSSTGERKYVGQNRTRGTIEGYIEKNLFDMDRVYLHIVEEGQTRVSSSFFELSVDQIDALSGAFSSMVADSSGEVKWQRDEF